MKVTIDTETCIGCGVCVSVAPDIFEIGEDGKAHVKENPNIDESLVQSAAEQCPTQAIKIE